jgi:hypothetical protein
MSVLLFSTTFVETFLILRRTERDYDEKGTGKVPVILVRS